MDSFFDTNIVINYSSYNSNSKKSILLKCYEYVQKTKGNFYICFRVYREIKDVRKKLAKIQLEVLKKLKDKNYEFDLNSGILNKKDYAKLKQLYLLKANKPYMKVLEEFEETKNLLNLRINIFLEKKLKETVIPEEKIDKKLVSDLHNFINNRTDCEILASAIEFQKNRETFFFVTADEDFAPNDYDYIVNDQIFKDKKFPKLKNLLYS